MISMLILVIYYTIVLPGKKSYMGFLATNFPLPWSISGGNYMNILYNISTLFVNLFLTMKIAPVHFHI